MESVSAIHCVRRGRVRGHLDSEFAPPATVPATARHHPGVCARSQIVLGARADVSDCLEGVGWFWQATFQKGLPDFLLKVL